MINVVVIMFGDLVEDVSAYKNESDAKEFFEKQTSVNFDVFAKRIKDEDTETILGAYAGSNIYEVELK